MHELLLLRHAEALPAQAGHDRDRHLSPHGQSQARAVGDWLAGLALRPEQVLCSDTRRTRTTAALALAPFTPAPPITFLTSIYDATPGELLALLARHEQAGRVLLVGHNPGVSGLLVALCPDLPAGTAMAPATVAHIILTGPIAPGQGHLKASLSS
ncbi:MAG TPA: histidine phosphatase family protein [Rhodanobacteraceae bacterium]